MRRNVRPPSVGLDDLQPAHAQFMQVGGSRCCARCCPVSSVITRQCFTLPCCSAVPLPLSFPGTHNRSCDPLQLVPLPFGGSSNNQQPLWFVLVNPKFEAPTKEMRAVLPKEVSLSG